MNQQEFETQTAQEGYALPVRVEREACYALGEHVHEFDAKALILEGVFEITVAGVTRLYRTGDVFTLPRGTVHTERSVGGTVTYLSARRA